ncbi:MAG: metal ABC transporter substrate-binding protein [Bifidobacteriaceae bacterium]|jgi:zinc transport system substrate-binding protein|nr:metal ABC transporter substrate-binding protein [Bifidobacteriaceae bacterium]
MSAATLAGCASAPATVDDDGPSVLVSFYPLQFLAERIGGPDTAISSLTPPGAEPHDLELSPAQVANVGRADLVVYVAGFQAAVDEAIAARTPAHVVDAAALTNLTPLAAETSPCPTPDTSETAICEAPNRADEPLDPHFWLDPTRMEPVADAIADALSGIAPDRAETYKANRDQTVSDLIDLDERFEEGLATCANRTIVATHAAFGYMAARYGLTQLSVGGIDPDAEPSPARIREVAALLEGTGATTVFFESQASPEIARTLADQVGLTAEVLDPLEAAGDGNYLTRMSTDLATLRAALQCQ